MPNQNEILNENPEYTNSIRLIRERLEAGFDSDFIQNFLNYAWQYVEYGSRSERVKADNDNFMNRFAEICYAMSQPEEREFP